MLAENDLEVDVCALESGKTYNMDNRNKIAVPPVKIDINII